MKSLRIVNIAALFFMLVINGLASGTNLIGGQPTGAVSDAYQNLFTPAGYVFSIWGVIYIGLIALAIYQARSSQDAEVVRSRMGPWFAINAILNGAWLFFWGAELLWPAVVVMLGILTTLIALYTRLGIGQTPAAPGERWAVRLPISIYTGWISVATIANVAAALVSIGFSGFVSGNLLGPQFWFVLVVAAAVALGLLAAIWRRDAAYGLVIVWSLVGITVALGPQPEAGALDLLAAAAAVIVAVGVVLGQARRKRALAGA